MLKSAKCRNCKIEFKYDDTQKYGRWCTNKCQMDYQYKSYIERWKKGEEIGLTGKFGLSNHIRRYLFEQHNSCCSQCEWSKKNPATGKVPLHINHIDGDMTNNTEKNLQLLCPNCHSLTENFGILNRGNGRYSRTGTEHPKFHKKGD